MGCQDTSGATEFDVVSEREGQRGDFVRAEAFFERALRLLEPAGPAHQGELRQVITNYLRVAQACGDP